jgi:hypothetical protein
MFEFDEHFEDIDPAKIPHDFPVSKDEVVQHPWHYLGNQVWTLKLDRTTTRPTVENESSDWVLIASS